MSNPSDESEPQNSETTDTHEKTAPLLCGLCERPVFFNPSAENGENPHQCGCPNDSQPTRYVILTRDELMDRLDEFVSNSNDTTTDSHEFM